MISLFNNIQNLLRGLIYIYIYAYNFPTLNYFDCDVKQNIKDEIMNRFLYFRNLCLVQDGLYIPQL
jgi:uncharacterized membrane protein YesL